MSFIIICTSCNWNFTREYIRLYGNDPRPMYGDVCSCGGEVKRVDVK